MLVIGLIIGGLIGVFIMCMLQINRDNKLQLENKKLKERIKLLEKVLVRDKFNFANPQVLTFKVDILESRIKKAIKFIEDDYYLKTTIKLDDIAMTTNKMLKVREILKGADSNG